MKKLILLFSTLYLIAFTASSEVFKWVDPHGGVHFSDHPINDKYKNTSSTPSPQPDPPLTSRERSEIYLIKWMMEFSEEEKNEKNIRTLVNFKSSLNNPESFQLIRIIRMPNGHLCITFRATNAFNAVMVFHEAIDWGGTLVDYDYSCSRGGGRDVTYLKNKIQ